MDREDIHLGPSRSAVRFRLCACVVTSAVSSAPLEAHKHLIVVAPWRRACLTTRGRRLSMASLPGQGPEPVYAGLWGRGAPRSLLAARCAALIRALLRPDKQRTYALICKQYRFPLVIVLYIVQHFVLKALLDKVRLLIGAVARLNQVRCSTQWYEPWLVLLRRSILTFLLSL